MNGVFGVESVGEGFVSYTDWMLCRLAAWSQKYIGTWQTTLICASYVGYVGARQPRALGCIPLFGLGSNDVMRFATKELV